MSDKPILVVIPCLNEEAHLAPLVTHLLAGNPHMPLHIVIVDGGSTDNTAVIAKELAERHAGVSCCHNPKTWQSAAVNLAVARFGDGSDVLIRIDAHADYPAGYIETLVLEAQRRQADAVVVAMDTRGVTPFQRAVAAAQNSRLGNGGAAHRNAGGTGRWVDHGHHALMRIPAFRAVGGYDESFSHNEDAELDARLIKAGHRIWLTSETALVYYPRADMSGLFRQYRHYGAGRARNLIRHRTKPRLRQLLPLAVAPAAALALLAPVSALFALPLLAWAGLCLACGALLAWRAKSAALLASGPAAMIMHFAWSLGFWCGAVKALRTENA